MIGLVIVLFVTANYSIAWVKSYSTSRTYYVSAMKNYNNNEMEFALKGNKVLSEDKSGYVYEGGFQQCIEIWNSPYALPKPEIVGKAEAMAERTVNSLDVETAQAIFNSYFKLDNAYLPEVLLRIGDIYLEDEKFDEAEQQYEMVREIFGKQEGIPSMVDKKLKMVEEKR